MRFLALVLLVVGLGVLAVVVWVLLNPPEAHRPSGRNLLPERAQVVSGEVMTRAVGTDAAAASEERPSPPEDTSPGPLCDRAPDGHGAEAVALPASHSLRQGPPTRGPTWTWVNLWAAWCKPCKEEMPILSAWATRLRERGAPLRVLFLSVDDDERQLQRFMAEQGHALPDEFRWVPDEAARSRFYRSLGLEDPPTLPVQIVLDPKSRLRCLRVGSITPRDLDEAARRFGW